MLCLFVYLYICSLTKFVLLPRIYRKTRNLEFKFQECSCLGDEGFLNWASYMRFLNPIQKS